MGRGCTIAFFILHECGTDRILDEQRVERFTRSGTDT
jgi:hypothetical protein